MTESVNNQMVNYEEEDEDSGRLLLTVQQEQQIQAATGITHM